MYRIRFFFHCLAWLWMCVLGTTHGADDLSKVYGKANKAVVLIDFKDGVREVGSGVIVGIVPGGAALILTANHVVQGYQEVRISFAGVIDKQYVGKVSRTLVADVDDLAIIVVPKPPPDLEMISFRQSVAQKGETVGTIGHPQGEAYTWSDGAIKNIFGKYIIHSAELAVGSSGGPLLDTCGRMLGMNVQLIQRPVSSDAPNEPKEAVEDSLEVGSGVTLASGSILAIIDGWFSQIPLNEKWEVKKYCSFWEKARKDPKFIATEVGLIGGIVYLVARKREVEIFFGEPPGPPSGQ